MPFFSIDHRTVFSMVEPFPKREKAWTVKYRLSAAASSAFGLHERDANAIDAQIISVVDPLMLIFVQTLVKTIADPSCRAAQGFAAALREVEAELLLQIPEKPAAFAEVNREVSGFVAKGSVASFKVEALDPKEWQLYVVLPYPKMVQSLIGALGVEEYKKLEQALVDSLSVLLSSINLFAVWWRFRIAERPVWVRKMECVTAIFKQAFADFAEDQRAVR